MANDNTQTFFCIPDGNGDVYAVHFETRDGAQEPPSNSQMALVQASNEEEAKQAAKEQLDK